MDTAYKIATIASFTVTGLVAALNAIAPLTKTNKDNKFLEFLVFLHDKILAVILPFLAAKVAADADAKTAVK